MRHLMLIIVLVATTAAPAWADKPPLDPVRQPLPEPCHLVQVTHDWDFELSDHGFMPVDCDQGGVAVWEWGPPSGIPGAPARVWGTVLNGDYPENSGLGLVSPPFVVDPQSNRLEVLHWFSTEMEYDGCNVSVGQWPNSIVIEPLGGYTVPQISPSTSFYAFCVDGEPGWTGPDGQWRIDCFDLSPFMGQDIQLQFDFGSDASVGAPGWFLGYARVGAVEVPYPQHIEIAVGDWLMAEPWHFWIGPEAEVPIRLLAGWGEDPAWIEHVEFFYSTDGGANWTEAGIDWDGSEPWFDTHGGAIPAGDGWATVATLPLPIPEPLVLFKAVAFLPTGDTVEAVSERIFDEAPPSLVQVNVEDWMIIEQEPLEAIIDPTIVDIDRIAIWVEPKQEEFYKGIPGISQHPHSSNHCAPTATAQCFKYFEQAHGDDELTGGLEDHPLVDSLAVYMDTSSFWGTSCSDWIAGIAEWIRSHGDGYTVRSFWHYDNQGNSTWTQNDWRRMRNELERCQDVLSGVFWPGGGGHAMTLNSIRNTPMPNGRIGIDFMDPWTANAEWGALDPDTGNIENLGGAGGGGSGDLGLSIIICPKETEPGTGGPGELVWFDPNTFPAPIPIPILHPGPWFVHFDVISAIGHSHRITRIVDYQPSTYAPEQSGAMPTVLYLSQSNPNPFRASTAIPYAVPTEQRVEIAVYDVTGRQVRSLVDGTVSAGFHSVEWDGRDDRNVGVPSGVYYVRMQTGTYEKTRSVTVLK